MEKEMKPVFFSKNSDELIKLENKLMLCGYKTSHDSYLDCYYISVYEKQYKECLLKGRNIADSSIIGVINYYGDLIPLWCSSLAIAEFKYDGNSDYEWLVTGNHLPLNIRKMLEYIQSQLGFKVDIKVDLNANVFEFICNEKDINYIEVSSKLIDILNNEFANIFKRVEKVDITGKILITNSIKRKNNPHLFNIFKYSMFIQGLNFPYGNNIAPKVSESETLDVNHYHSSSRCFSGEIIKEEYQEKKNGFIVNYGLKLYETKKYASYWNAKKQCERLIIPFRRLLLDIIDATCEVEILSDNEIQVTTDYRLDRKVEYKGIKPFNFRDPKSVRNGMIPIALEDGILNGRVIEHFVKIANGTRLLHFSQITDAFEVYDLPKNFSFNGDLSVVNGKAKVFDENNFDYSDKDLEEISKYIKRDILMLIKKQKYVN